MPEINGSFVYLKRKSPEKPYQWPKRNVILFSQYSVFKEGKYNTNEYVEHYCTSIEAQIKVMYLII